jgi:hypothetical protein
MTARSRPRTSHFTYYSYILASWVDAGIGMSESNQDAAAPTWSLSPTAPWEEHGQHAARQTPFHEHRGAFQFGGVNSRRHDCVVKLEPGYDGAVRVHLVVQRDDKRHAVRDVLAWDPVMESLVWTDRAELGLVACELDTSLALCAITLLFVRGVVEGVSGLLETIASPNVILIGGIFPILIAVWLFYAALWFAVKLAFLWVFLPGLIIGAVIGAIRGPRLSRFEEAVIRTARAAIDDYRASSSW